MNDDIENKNMKLPRMFELTANQSLRKYDRDSMHVRNEIGIGNLSKEDAEDAVRPPPQFALTVPRAKTIPYQPPDPNQERYMANEQIIGAKATEYRDPSYVPPMGNFGVDGSANTPMPAMGGSYEHRGEPKQMRRENRLDDRYEAPEDD